MRPAAAARTWWAAQSKRVRERDSRSGDPSASSVNAAFIMLLVLAAITMACAAIGFIVAEIDDDRLAAEQHAAMRVALDEFRTAFGATDRFDDTQLRMIERHAGLRDLRFAAEPPEDGGREVQSWHDAEGRIVGWLSWSPDRSFARAMEWLWVLAGIAGGALAACALFAARATRGLAGALARSHDTVRKLSTEDGLTGLPNHRAMLARLDEALARRRSGIVVFAVIDLDGFREVNDTLGRADGDALLINISGHLQAGLPAGAVFGRFEEDEFAVILSSEDARAAQGLADSLRAALLRPVFLDRVRQITAGIGLAQAPDDGASGAELSRRAELALRAAKRAGRGMTRRFEPQIETEYADRRFLLRELQTAISLQALDVYYQPIVAADGGAIVGVEALLRWNHPARGAIDPSVFIPLAEQSGLMSQLGEIVLRRALADGARWPDISVAVNLSPLQIRDRWLVDLVAAVMAEAGIASSRVVLEVTEGVLIDNPQEALARLEALRALGVGIALDDFGTGYSSLSYLQRFPFDRVKIDRAFVASLGIAANTAAIIQAIVTLGHGLGMSVLAEGVETDEQRVLLRLAGCDEMQGYLFARPAPAEEIDRLFARREPPAPERPAAAAR